MVTSNAMEQWRRNPSLSKEIGSPRKQPANAPIFSKSPTSNNKRRPSLVIDTKDDRDSERTHGDGSRVAVLAQSISPTSATFSKLITNMRSSSSGSTNNKQRLQQTYQASPNTLSTIHGAASPKSKPNLVIDTAGSFPSDENSPQVSPSLFQQSANKVSLLHLSFSSEASECDDNHSEQRQHQSRSPVAAFSKLQINPLSGRDDEHDKTASRVSNFIDTLHQQKGITPTPRGTGNTAQLPPKSPSVARLASNHKYSSILKNARNVIASSPVAKANAGAASFKVSPQSNNALARRKNILQKAAKGYQGSDSDSYDSSDDSSYSSDSSLSSNEVSTSTKKDVGEFIDTLNKRNEQKVEKDMQLLSLKTKLNTRRHEKETAAKTVTRDKPKCNPPSADEKKNPTVATSQGHASKNNIKNDALNSKLDTRRHEKEPAARKVVQEEATCDPPAAEKTKCDPPGVDESVDDKKNDFTKAATPQVYASKHNIKKDVLKSKSQTAAKKVAQEKAKSDPPGADEEKKQVADERKSAGADEKKNEFTKVATPQDFASKHNIKKDIHYYAILSQVQKAVQSGNPAMQMGKIFTDAGKRGMKLSIVTELFKEENRKAKVFEPVKGVTGAQVEAKIRKKTMSKACVLAKEQLAAMTTKVDHPAKKAAAVQKKQSTSDNATSSKNYIVSESPAEEQSVAASKSVEDTAATSKEQQAEMTTVSVSLSKDKCVSASSNPKPSSAAPLIGGNALESNSTVSSVEIVTPPSQDMVNSASLASVSSESKGAHYAAALMSEVEAKVKEIVRSAAPSIEFGKILADAKKRGLPATHLIRLYKQEREELTNAAVKAASLVVKPECDNEVGSFKQAAEAEESKVLCPPKSAAGFTMKEKLTEDVKNAVRSSNPSEMLGNILADAQSKGLPTEWLFDLYKKERMKAQMEMQMATVAEQGAQPSASDSCSTESEVSDVVGELQMEAFSNVPTSATVQEVEHHTADVVDFFSKFSLQSESKEANVDSSGVKQVLAPSVSEVSQYEIVELNRKSISSESDVSEVPKASREVGRLSVEEEDGMSIPTSTRNNVKVRFETVHADEDEQPVINRLWKSPLQKQRLSRKKLNRGGKLRPINGVAAAAALTQKRRLRGTRRNHLTQSAQERTKEHNGFLDIDFYSLYESTTCHAENEEIDKAPWEYRDVRQRFLSEKSVDCRNWFGSFESKRGNDRVSNPVVCPKSVQIPVTIIPESGDWNEDWYTTWKSRRDNPNNLVTFTEADIPSISMNSSGTSNTSTTITESHSTDQSVQSSDSTYSEKKPVLIEIGNLVSVRFSGERVSKVHPDYTSSLRRSRWRKKYMRGEFAFDAEM